MEDVFDTCEFLNFCDRVLDFRPLPQQVEMARAAYEESMCIAGTAPGRVTIRRAYNAWIAVKQFNQHYRNSYTS